MFWNISLNIPWKNLSVDLSSALITVKVNNSLCTKHLPEATSVMHCAFFKNVKKNERNTIYLNKRNTKYFVKAVLCTYNFFSLLFFW